ncbi:hypothetical protein ABZV91_29590 [Nocardia sp. NPDC004568]|uniref:hypothetical protein n=1 Tax=Nocardia sp. NPDC004568 TaxID=3154551 RepID=UPI0033B47371
MSPVNRIVAVTFGYSTLIAVGIASVANLFNGTWSWKWVGAAFAFSCFLTWCVYERGQKSLGQMNAWIAAANRLSAEGRYLEASELIKRAGARSRALLGPQHHFTRSLLDVYRRLLDEENRENLTRLQNLLNDNPGTADQRTDPPADK